jgi:hypothetical protein
MSGVEKAQYRRGHLQALAQKLWHLPRVQFKRAKKPEFELA